jgi:hypothetical protein
LFNGLRVFFCLCCGKPLCQAGGGRPGALLGSFLLVPGSCRSFSFPLNLRLSLQLHPGC